jgi:hypothetical protein
MNKKKQQCRMPNCERKRHNGDLCSACYQRIRYWLRRARSPSVIMRRVKQLKLSMATMRMFR